MYKLAKRSTIQVKKDLLKVAANFWYYSANAHHEDRLPSPKPHKAAWPADLETY